MNMNQITPPPIIEKSVIHYSDKVQDFADKVVHFVVVYGLKIVGALFIFFIGKWFVQQLLKLMRKGMQKANIDETLISFSTNVIYLALIISLLMMAASNLGINPSLFVAVFGAASLAIGLALKDSLANVGAAVLIIFFRPFKISDYIEVSGVEGTVKAISLFSTTLLTSDNRSIIIPNGTLIRGNIINNTGNLNRRIDLIFDIDYKDDLKMAKEVISKILEEHPHVLAEPEYTVAVGALGDNAVQLYVRPWVLTKEYWNVRFDLIEHVKLAFDTKGISIPFPQMDVNIRQDKVS